MLENKINITKLRELETAIKHFLFFPVFTKQAHAHTQKKPYTVTKFADL